MASFVLSISLFESIFLIIDYLVLWDYLKSYQNSDKDWD